MANNTIFTQGHLPQVPMYFFGGPMDDRTMQAVRDTIFEGKGLDVLGGIYEVQWNNLRWEAHFVDNGTIRVDARGRPTVVRGTPEQLEVQDELSSVLGAVVSDPLSDRKHEIGNPLNSEKAVTLEVEKNGLVKP